MGRAIVGLAYLLARRNRTLLVALWSSGVAVAISVPSINSRVSDLNGAPRTEIGDGTANSLEWRIEYWQDIASALAENPLTGIGIDQVPSRTAAAAEPHSGYVQASSRPAILGLVALVGLVVALGRDLAARPPKSGHRHRSVARVRCHCSRGGFLIQLLTENLLTQVAIHLYLWIPIAYATSTLLRTDVPRIRGHRRRRFPSRVPDRLSRSATRRRT